MTTETTAGQSPAPAPVETKRFSVFVTIWAGQFVSLIGSELTAYALGVWAYQRTGSATAFTLIMVFAQLPIVLLAPIAGAYVDRWDRRRTLIGANALAAAAVGTLAVLVATGHFQLWFIYPTIGLVAVANALHWPAFATVPRLTVPKAHLARAAGMVELSSAIAKTIAPSLATLLVGIFMLTGVLVSDLSSFLIAIAALLLVRIPRPASAGRKSTSIGADIREGWRYLVARPGLVRLLMFFLVNNLFVVFPLVLAVPLVASFAKGAVLAAAIMSARRRPDRRRGRDERVGRAENQGLRRHWRRRDSRPFVRARGPATRTSPGRGGSLLFFFRRTGVERLQPGYLASEGGPGRTRPDFRTTAYGRHRHRTGRIPRRRAVGRLRL
ncbi:MFS transporter [Fodinicola feengrottensis]|uniref:MFS transporter n=1 Tax=Fodinicola feengrottensis TaxID=435914 RepID=UPI0013D72B18|nr:MFS transporter [Fodinicola feengrottensis]